MVIPIMQNKTQTIKPYIKALLAILCCTLPIVASASGESQRERFQSIMDSLESQTQTTVAERVLKIADMRLGTPYVAGTLEKEPESLVINIVETDCILFVESCLAMAMTMNRDYDDFKSNIQKLRYRGGVVDGYASRIHYTSEWIKQAEARKVVREISKEIGGSPLDQTFSFMSTHTKSYKQLANNPAEVKKIADVEKSLNTNDYYFIPKNQIPAVASKIRSGDIICFVGSTKGLDIAHVAIALWKDGQLTFMHASMKYMKAVIEPQSIASYCNSMKSNRGIRVVRIL